MTDASRPVVRGVYPVAPTVFADNEDLDPAGQRRVVDYLVDAGSSGICVLANYSEQFALTDAERDEVLATTLEQAADRVPVCVTTSHYSARIAAQRCRDAAERGAAMVMLMPPFFGATMSVGEDAVFEYFRRVVGDLDIDVMIQDAPMSPTKLSPSLIARIARAVPQVRYVKIETPQAAGTIEQLGALGDDLPGRYDGEEAITLIPDLEAGAVGTMSSAMVPHELGDIVRQWLAGDHDTATRAWEGLLPLIHYENRQCGLHATKVVLHEGGVIDSAATRAPFPPLRQQARERLIAMAKERDVFALRWAA